MIGACTVPESGTFDFLHVKLLQNYKKKITFAVKSGIKGITGYMHPYFNG